MHNWNSLGDIRALEVKAADWMKNEAATIAHMAIKLVDNIKYLNGCVKRGRGVDIDAERPARNVFEYIKELEAKYAKLVEDHTEMQGIAQNALIELEQAKTSPDYQRGQEEMRERAAELVSNFRIHGLKPGPIGFMYLLKAEEAIRALPVQQESGCEDRVGSGE